MQLSKTTKKTTIKTMTSHEVKISGSDPIEHRSKIQFPQLSPAERANRLQDPYSTKWTKIIQIFRSQNLRLILSYHLHGFFPNHHLKNRRIRNPLEVLPLLKQSSASGWATTLTLVGEGLENPEPPTPRCGHI